MTTPAGIYNFDLLELTDGEIVTLGVRGNVRSDRALETTVTTMRSE
jgi:hypothetical protein